MICPVCGSSKCDKIHPVKTYPRTSEPGLPQRQHNAPEVATNPGREYYDGDACWQAIEAAGFAREFDLGNVIKYVWRAGRKEGATQLEDLKKARDYLERAIGRLERSKET